MNKIAVIFLFLFLTSCSSYRDLQNKFAGQTFYHYETIGIGAGEDDFQLYENTASQLVSTLNRYFAKYNISIIKDPMYSVASINAIYNTEEGGYYRSTWDNAVSDQYKADNFLTQYKSEVWNHAVRKNGCTIRFYKGASWSTTVDIKLKDQKGETIFSISARDTLEKLNSSIVESLNKQ